MKTQFTQSPVVHTQLKVLPVSEYDELLEKAEMLDDIAAYDKAKAALKAGEDELIPSAVVDALLDGENALKVWRTYRGINQTELAELAELSQAYIAQIESGSRTGTVAVYRSLADALGLDVDDLV